MIPECCGECDVDGQGDDCSCEFCESCDTCLEHDDCNCEEDENEEDLEDEE